MIFVYHRFGNPKYPSTNISLANFEAHLEYLNSNHFTVLTFGEALEYISDSDQPFMEKVACITIDDGYKTFLSNGLPLLHKYKYKATLFINSESVGGGSYLDWNELEQVYEQGIEIGNHSHSHAYFVNIPIAQRAQSFRNDVMKCQEDIKKYLGFYPSVFAYPYGEFDLEMKKILKDLGFKGAAAQNSGVMHLSDNFAVPRFPMAGPYVKLTGFIEKANMKSLRVKNKSEDSFLLTGINPPKLIVEFDTAGVNLSRHNCFTSSECETTLNNRTLTIQAKNKIKGRRTLYTITAPAKNGKGWHWFSHLWINTDIQE